MQQALSYPGHKPESTSHLTSKWARNFQHNYQKRAQCIHLSLWNGEFGLQTGALLSFCLRSKMRIIILRLQRRQRTPSGHQINTHVFYPTVWDGNRARRIRIFRLLAISLRCKRLYFHRWSAQLCSNLGARADKIFLLRPCVLQLIGAIRSNNHVNKFLKLLKRVKTVVAAFYV